MANNRMYLVNARTGARVYLAKYYPSTGWYCVEPEGIGERLNAAFDQNDFGDLTNEQRVQNARHPGLGVPNPSAAGMWGDEWALEYETTTEEEAPS